MWLFYDQILIGFSLFAIALAQSVSFTVYPQQVVTGLTYTIAWNSGGQPISIELIRDGRRVDLLHTSDGTANTFQWTVQNSYSSGTDYALQLGSESRSSRVDNIYIINSDSGLVVSGSTIRTPSPTATINPAEAATLSTYVVAATASSTGALGPAGSALPDFSAAPSTTSTPEAHYTSHNVSGPAVAGILVGILAATALVGFGVWFCVRRYRLRNSNDAEPVETFYLAGGKEHNASTIRDKSSEVTLTDTTNDRVGKNLDGTTGTPELYSETLPKWDGWKYNESPRHYDIADNQTTRK